MKPSDVKDAIVDYLEHIVNRINYINHHHPDTDLSLDIDLVKDDMRVLYGKLELLKTMALPKRINIKDENAVTDNRYVKNTPVYDQQQTHQQHTASDFEQANKQAEPEADQPSSTNETHESSKQQDVDNEADKQPLSSPEMINPEAESFNELHKSESPPKETKVKPSEHDETDPVFEKPINERSETTQEIDDTPDISDVFEETGSPDKDPVAESESNSDAADRFETKQELLKSDLQYHQSGLDFSDPDAAPSETDASEQQFDAPDKEPHLNEGVNNLKDKGTKTVIELLSANRKKTIGDQYVEADNSLNKRISADKEDKSIGARMQQKPISNIKEVIGVNEKFLFINELFDGDIQEYHDAISRLNSMQHMHDAFDYLNTLSEKYSWDANRSAATIEKLANYVQRRYM